VLEPALMSHTNQGCCSFGIVMSIWIVPELKVPKNQRYLQIVPCLGFVLVFAILFTEDLLCCDNPTDNRIEAFEVFIVFFGNIVGIDMFSIQRRFA
jgi:hypothetical protein